ncbi:YbhB/YbcL family Raf kinase inhibitor-like protein [bacterium]|nr:YbhB/YbcL family Raf kinase inhibitor-like protein [bacterium]
MVHFFLAFVFAVTRLNSGDEPMNIESSVFKESEWIPKKYTCDGENISPPLTFNDIPKEAASLALICDDPDAPAGTWVHWIVYNLPATTDGLPEAMASDQILAGGAKQGINDFRDIGYGGPCPPSGTHRYYFKLYALNQMLDLDAGATKWQLTQAMKGHVIVEAQLMGRYKR